MRWKCKPRPKYGDKKSANRFAFFPRKIKGVYIWLENYRVVKTYTKDGITHVGMTGVFDFDGWVKRKELIN